MKTRVCELCSGEASLYCVSDSAFLCWSCDLRVHQANFLVARHVRLTVCSKCNEFDGNRRSGTGFKSFKPICVSCCSSENKDQKNQKSVSSSSSLSSDCISTTGESFKSAEDQPKAIKFYDFFDLEQPNNNKKKKIDCSSDVTDVDSCFLANFSGEFSSEKTQNRSRKATDHDHQLHRVKAEGILVNWCRKLGLKVNGHGGENNCVLPFALQAFGVCLERITVLPFRVALASSLWFSLRGRRRGSLSATCQSRAIRRVVEISGVPAKLIILGELKISRVLNLNRRSQDGENQEEEGWAECTE